MNAVVHRWGPSALRVTHWHNRDDIAVVAPVPGTTTPDASAVRRSVSRLQSAGVTHVVTGALAKDDASGFLEAGFSVRERLHLLIHDLNEVDDDPPAPSMRRARRGDRASVLAVDRLAFEGFWQLDEEGLADAIRATPTARFRVVATPTVIGYAICGRAGRQGYVQRLALHPDHQRRGLGRALVLDGLQWLQRRGAARAVVNTQEENDAALHLYERLGFVRQRDGLSVLELHLDGSQS